MTYKNDNALDIICKDIGVDYLSVKVNVFDTRPFCVHEKIIGKKHNYKI